MKIKNIIFFGIIFILSVLLTGFSNWRNQQRLIKVHEVIFESGNSKFLSFQLINSLLQKGTNNFPKKIKDGLDLDTLELLLEENPYIYNAEVYYNLKGLLGVRIKEQTPELKILSDSIFYYSNEGVKIPLSEKYNPELPSFIGKPNKNEIEDLLFLIMHFKEDDFFKNQLNTIRYELNSYYIKLHSFDFEVEFGSVKNIEEKIKKLKVFSAFQKSIKRKSNYKKISLKYNKQIVAS
ncbi:MAG: hypothetical protein VX325_06255 [Bacteroidota bacterium]|nr:hypothetical protein [Bacteroidota bacterium]